MSFLSNIISASFLCNSLFSGFVRYLTHLFRLISLIFHWFYALCIVLWSGKVLIKFPKETFIRFFIKITPYKNGEAHRNGHAPPRFSIQYMAGLVRLYFLASSPGLAPASHSRYIARFRSGLKRLLALGMGIGSPSYFSTSFR